MKKIMYLFCTLFILAVACDHPGEELNAEADQKNKLNELTVSPSVAALVTCAPATFGSIATTYNTFFTRGYPAGDPRGETWTGADATWSVPLGNGKILWSFGDTFVGSSNPPDASHSKRWRATSEYMISNSFMIQNTAVTPNTWVTVTGGVDPNTWKWLPVARTGLESAPDGTREWYWPGDATIKSGTVYMFFHRFRLSQGKWLTTATDLMTFSVSTLSGLSGEVAFTSPATTTRWYTVPSPDTLDREISFGNGLFEEGTSNYFVYAADKVDYSPFGKWHAFKVARVAQSNINGTRSYFTGYGSSPTYTPQWSTTFPGPGNASGNMKELSGSTLKDLLLSPQFSVLKIGSKYRLIGQEDGGRNIYSFESASPVGPWECKTSIYVVPEPNTLPVITYNASLHAEIRNNGRYLVSYNLNGNTLADVYNNIDTYRPKFIWINLP
jgi:hypothetical protein